MAVALVFGQTVTHDFTNYDDDEYVTANAHVYHGVTIDGLVWAFTHYEAANWHPLTWFSHMLDCQVYGFWAGGHHLTSVLLHAVNAMLLFLVLLQMTGRRGSSAVVAALFAIHPLRVESVAWVAERKDLLSGLFFLLTLSAYQYYASRPFSPLRYLAVLCSFGMGLMCKPMLVTVPLLLLVLDDWPLGRVDWLAALARPAGLAAARRVLVEKLPLLVLSVASCMVTLQAQRQAIESCNAISAWDRIANAAVSYLAYLHKWLWPTGLAVLYPYPPPSHRISLWVVVASCGLLLGIGVMALALRRRHPYLLMGWLWYVGMLAPVIGLVQVGNQAMADRYTYLPMIGPGVAIVWCASDLLRRVPRFRRTCSWGLACVLAFLTGFAWRQTAYWCDSETLWRRALECTSENYVAHYNLAIVLAGRGRTEEAIDHDRQVIEIAPRPYEAHNHLGVLLAGQGRFNEAIVEYRKALKYNPTHVKAYAHLSQALANSGKIEESVLCYRKVLELKPNDAEVYTSLGLMLAGRGLAAEAMAQYRKAIEINPRYREAYNNLGNALARCGDSEEALACWNAALDIDPRYADARNNLGLALAGQGRTEEAIDQFQQALQANPGYAEARWNLGAALLRQRKATEAVAQWREAVRLDPHNVDMLTRLAWLMATSADASLRNGAEAEKLAEQAVQLSGGRDPMILRTLAAAYAEAGQFADAQRTAETAFALISDDRHVAAADALRKDIASYRGGSPLREVAP